MFGFLNAVASVALQDESLTHSQDYQFAINSNHQFVKTKQN